MWPFHLGLFPFLTYMRNGYTMVLGFRVSKVLIPPQLQCCREEDLWSWGRKQPWVLFLTSGSLLVFIGVGGLEVGMAVGGMGIEPGRRPTPLTSHAVAVFHIQKQRKSSTDVSSTNLSQAKKEEDWQQMLAQGKSSSAKNK